MPPLTHDELIIKPLQVQSTEWNYMSRLLDATAGFNKNVTVVDEISNVAKFCNDLKQCNELIVDCEGVRLGRGGKLTLVQIMAKDGAIFIFDALVLGKSLFDHGLKSVLESTSISKIMFDCRRDSESLFYEFNVKLTNVLDMQLFEYMVREIAGKNLPQPCKPYHYRKPCIRGLDNTVNTYVNFSDIISKSGIRDFKRVKTESAALMKLDRTVWRYRPLHDGLRDYAALDVVMIDLVQNALKRFMALQGLTIERLHVASERYVGVRRDFELAHDVYVNHAMLLSHIIPKIRGNSIVPFLCEDVKCHSCKRMLTKNFVVQSKCEDCREIERANRYRRK